MFEIKITVDPTFTAAVNALAGALAAKINTTCNNAAVVQSIAPVTPTTVPATPGAPAMPIGVPTAAAAPVQNVPTAVPAVPTAPAPAAPAPAAVPTSAPTFTMEQISRAGTMLIDMGKMNDLMALLTRHGVAAITQLKPESYGAVATELRALGAQI